MIKKRNVFLHVETRKPPHEPNERVQIGEVPRRGDIISLPDGYVRVTQVVWVVAPYVDAADAEVWAVALPAEEVYAERRAI